MAPHQSVHGHTVEIDLSKFEKPDQDLVRMHMLLEHGMHQATVTGVGLVIAVHVPTSLRQAATQEMADALIPTARHRKA